MPPQDTDTIWTVGHSKQTGEALLALLTAHGIAQLVDVRAIPYSQRHPQFNRERLARSLRGVGLQYLHCPELGGRRSPRPGSINCGWRNEGFRGYADYMQTDEFAQALERLMAICTEQPTAILCAEALPWRCHRSLVADALVTRGRHVRHILSPWLAQPHLMTAFAKIEGGRLTYPVPDHALRLF